MTNKILVCAICRKPNCDGKVYVLPKRFNHHDGPIKVCRNSEEFRIIKNVPFYHYVIGHGNEFDVPLFPEETPEDIIENQYQLYLDERDKHEKEYMENWNRERRKDKLKEEYIKLHKDEIDKFINEKIEQEKS